MGVAAALASCIKDPVADYGAGPAKQMSVPDGKVRLTLHTNTGEYQVPVTRAGYSNDDNDKVGYTSFSEARLPIVLVFELPESIAYAGTDAQKAEILRTNAVFSEAVQTTDGGSVPTVELAITERPVRLLIVANPPEKYFDGTTAALDFTPEVLNASTTLSGKTFAEAVDAVLNTDKLASPRQTVPYVGEHTPMTGIKDLAAISAGLTSIGDSGNKIFLKRVSAKITVASSADEFVLQGATVLNTKQYGMLYRDYDPGTEKYTAVPSGNQTNYLSGSGDTRVTGIAAAVGGNTEGSPLYVYESAAGEIVVLVQGKYDGSSTSTWYRLALKSQADGSALAIDRNKHYQVQIAAVGKSGYESIDEALTATAFDNIVAEVKVTELSGHLTEYNGSYYLSVSHNGAVYFTDELNKDLPLLTVSTNAPAGMKIKVEDVTPLPQDNLEFNWTEKTLTGGEAAYELTCRFTAALDDQYFIPEASDMGDGNRGVYQITVGDLSHTITVVQGWPMPDDPAYTDRGDEFTGSSFYNFLRTYYLMPINFSSPLYGDVDYKDGDQDWIWFSEGKEEDASLDTRHQSFDLYKDGDITTFGLGMDYNKDEARTASLTFFEGNGNGRTRLYLKQDRMTFPDTGEVTGGGNETGTGGTYYVGAFWKTNQIGERKLTMKVPYGTQYAGDWIAYVLDYGNYFKEGDILFDEGLGDNDGTGDPDLNGYYVTGNKVFATGTIANSGSITFRIGLKEAFTTANGYNATSRPARYARVVVAFGTKDGVKYGHNRIIYIRQGGEDGDYLFKPGEVDILTNAAFTQSRSKAVKWLPYNLTTSGTNFENSPYYVAPARNKGILTAYPSQTGAFWQFSSPSPRRGYNPVVSEIAGWDTGSTTGWSTAQETCPTGYRRPVAAQESLTGNEFYHSLSGAADLSTNAFTNQMIGYYADGYFDRNVITKSPVTNKANTAVNPTSVDVAYKGMLLYNPLEGSTHHNASIFFPFSGLRSGYEDTLNNAATSELRFAGEGAYYWSSTTHNAVHYGNYYGVYTNLRLTGSSIAKAGMARSTGMAIRCVK